MLTRRDTLRLFALATLATSSSAALAACSGGDDGGDGGGTGGGADGAGLKLAASDVERSAGTPAAIPDVVTGMHEFAGGLFGRLATKKGNLALSPYSVAVALGMTLNGARGATAAEMRTVLGVADTARFNGGLNALTRVVEGLAGPAKRADGSAAEVALDAANALFGDRSTPWAPAFLDTLAREYGAGMRTVDFIKHTEEARTLINGWTADRTHDKIPEIIPEGILDALTRLVLVNALYFKAPWEVPFEKSMTAKRPFRFDDGTTTKVDTMSAQLGAAGHGRGEGWQAVRLPYAGSTLAMTVIVPADPPHSVPAGYSTLERIESDVTAGKLPTMLAAIKPGGVALTMPKWTFRTDSSLKPALMALGMPTAFGDTADFSAMTTDDTALLIKAVLHQTFVAVDEEGTEAAAATAVVMGETSMPIYEQVVVDRPFLFVIHDVEHGTPLFLGRVADPTSA
ncbi:MAG TPA: serpin family protein [Nocardioides sp.]